MTTTPGHVLDAGVEDSDDVFALTEHGRALHLVDGDGWTDTSIIGVRARCGRRMRRLAHPSDHRNGRAHICNPCENAAPEVTR